MIEVDKLAFRAYIIPAATYNMQVLNGPCYLNTAITTSLGTAGYQYTILDGATSQGVVLFQGDTTALQGNNLRLVCTTGHYFFTTGAPATFAGWTFILAVIPPDMLD